MKYAPPRSSSKLSVILIFVRIFWLWVSLAGRRADFLPGEALARANQALTKGSHQFSTPDVTFSTNKTPKYKCKIHLQIRVRANHRFPSLNVLQTVLTSSRHTMFKQESPWMCLVYDTSPYSAQRHLSA